MTTFDSTVLRYGYFVLVCYRVDFEIVISYSMLLFNRGGSMSEFY